jgi:hypothetical protein
LVPLRIKRRTVFAFVAAVVVLVVELVAVDIACKLAGY